MTQRLYGFSILAAVLAALTLSGPATAREQVPFKGGSSGVVTAVGFDPVAGIAYTRVEGEGQATHLGRFTVTGNVAVDVATGIPLGTWTLTAANGDALPGDGGDTGSTKPMGSGPLGSSAAPVASRGRLGTTSRLLRLPFPSGLRTSSPIPTCSREQSPLRTRGGPRPNAQAILRAFPIHN